MHKIIPRRFVFALFGALLLSFALQGGFLAEQRNFERVRAAINDKQDFLTTKLRENKFIIGDIHVLFVAFKDSDRLDIFAKSRQEVTFRKLFSYEICSRSGHLGPKRRQGDGQVPEGFYHINRFNPNSNFFLSLGLNYPNLADKRKSKYSELGGDIFIHGSCVTVGCMPMTDNYIKEIYLLAVHARNNGQIRIPVYVFPFPMTDSNMTIYRAKYKDKKELVSFWDNLKIGYDKFHKEKKELNIKVSGNGDYAF